MAPPGDMSDSFRQGNRFPTTHWTALQDPAQREALKTELYEQYWDPLYYYLRRRGLGREDAEDHVEGFLSDILLEREFISKADRTKGHFRSLLKKALDRHIGMHHRKKKVRIVKSADPSEMDFPEAVPRDPSDALDYAWATRILDRALVDLETECRRDGLETHWHLFRERKLLSLFENTPAASMPELCSRYGIASAKQASGMIPAVCRRLAKILRRYLVRPDAGDEVFQEALVDFMAIFERG